MPSISTVPTERCAASIVVCTYNRAEMLRAALESLLKLRVPEVGDVQGGIEKGGIEKGGIEIVVIDNGSTDHTSEVVRAVQQIAQTPLRYFLETKQGVAHARNRGLEEARGLWIAFFDDDQLADPEWLIELLAAAEQQQTLCVGGAVKLLLPEDHHEPLSGVCRVLLSESPEKFPAGPYRDPRTPGTGNLLIQRNLARRLGGFNVHATMGGEDTDLYRRLRREGVVAWYEPKAIIYHHIPRERLCESYMLWNASRTGVHVADIEHRHFGKCRFIVRLILRLGQACLKGPGIAGRRYWASSASQRTGASCILAAAEGYLRRTAQWYMPNWCAQHEYFQKLDFRSEREQFGS